MKKKFIYPMDFGVLTIAEVDGIITDLTVHGVKDGIEEETLVIKEAYHQLKDYLAGARNEFDLPLAPQGTEFQKQVWQALQTIPYGETRSYKDIAIQIGNPKASRAIGMANNKNPIFIVIPCHRVIGANGKLVGYGGGLDLKQRLLKLETKSDIS